VAKKKVEINTSLIEGVGRVVVLHKVGINWFGRCPYCRDSGSHFLVPSHGEYWQCLLCNKKGNEVPVIKKK